MKSTQIYKRNLLPIQIFKIQDIYSYNLGKYMFQNIQQTTSIVYETGIHTIIPPANKHSFQCFCFRYKKFIFEPTQSHWL